MEATEAKAPAKATREKEARARARIQEAIKEAKAREAKELKAHCWPRPRMAERFASPSTQKDALLKGALERTFADVADALDLIL